MPDKTSERVGLLALAWDRKVQVARLVKSELKIYRKMTLKSSAVGVTWLDDQVSFLFGYACGLKVSGPVQPPQHTHTNTDIDLF